jgi:hypothetical protein
MRVSVLTVTKRLGWLEQAYRQLKTQTFHNFDWVIVSEQAEKLNKEFNKAVEDNQDDELYLLFARRVKIYQAPAPIRVSNLNRSLNLGIRQCSNADYIIFYQDFIDLDIDCFEKLLDNAVQDERTFVTTATINDDGNLDARHTGINKVRKCRPDEWEANVSIAPMKIIKKLGGFDEEYDNGWSWDNVNLAQRAALLGAKFLLDETNNPQLLYHEKETSIPINLKFHSKNIYEVRHTGKRLILDYLSSEGGEEQTNSVPELDEDIEKDLIIQE